MISKFFSKCALNKLTIKQNDYVCVINGDNTLDNSLSTCWVAKVLHLYEDLGSPDKPKFKALIQWYSRPADLKQRVDDPESLNKLDKYREVVQDDREEIDIDSIFDIAAMFKSKSECDKTEKPEARFFCNLKLEKVAGRKKFCLVPLHGSKTSDKISLVLKKVGDSPHGKWAVKMNNIPEEHVMNSIENLCIQRTPKRSSSKPFYGEHSDDESPVKKTPKSSRRKTIINDENDGFSPTKKSRMNFAVQEDTPGTPKLKSIPTRRKSILKTPTSASKPGTPRRSIQFSGFIEELRYNSHKNEIKENYNEEETEFSEARRRLHVSAVPSSLPCRDKEFEEIYSFLATNLEDEIGGCMYISGVPGTGKTATTTEVIRALRNQVKAGNLPDFDCVEINGMKCTEPRKAYQEIYRQLAGKTVPWEQAYNLLDKRFTTISKRRVSTILIVDELDILCNKRQDVVYNLLNWPNLNGSRLIVVTIANTMDLPERVLMGKVTSRLGLTRLTFQPYSYKQLQEIVASRLSGLDSFNADAIQLVSRKVAALSGDARRALDICRRASEIAERDPNNKNLVNMSHVTEALSEMISSTKVRAIKACSQMERMFIQAVCMEVERTGIEEVNFRGVYNQLKAVTTLNDIPLPNTAVCFSITTKLNASRLLICEHARKDIHMKILLNISTDDFYYATQMRNNND